MITFVAACEAMRGGRNGFPLPVESSFDKVSGVIEESENRGQSSAD